jgi:hypothetical protein
MAEDVLPERRTADVPIIGTSIGAVVVPVAADESMLAIQLSSTLTTAMYHLTYEQVEQLENELHNLKLEMKRPGKKLSLVQRKKGLHKV